MVQEDWQTSKLSVTPPPIEEGGPSVSSVAGTISNVVGIVELAGATAVVTSEVIPGRSEVTGRTGTVIGLAEVTITGFVTGTGDVNNTAGDIVDDVSVVAADGLTVIAVADATDDAVVDVGPAAAVVVEPSAVGKGFSSANPPRLSP